MTMCLKQKLCLKKSPVVSGKCLLARISMEITCISDLHGYTPELPGGDVLIVAGDLTARDEPNNWDRFYQWLLDQPYKRKLFIAGNHDNELQKNGMPEKYIFCGINYLQDTGCEIEGLKFWGSPWTLNFFGQNPDAKAFGLDTDEEMQGYFHKIPTSTDILITHTPPYGILDQGRNRQRFGSRALEQRLKFLPSLKIMVFGHIHGGSGMITVDMPDYTVRYINAAHVDDCYDDVNSYKQITVERP